MVQTIITTALSTVTGLIIGFLINSIKTYKKKDKTEAEALTCLLRSNITSKYYIYNEIGEIPSYEKQDINYLYEAYKKMGGNSYVKEIVEEINQLPTKK